MVNLNRRGVRTGWRETIFVGKGRVKMRDVVLCGLFLLLVSVTGSAKPVRHYCDFGKDYLGVDYIFWCTEEPYYSEQLIPFMKR